MDAVATCVLIVCNEDGQLTGFVDGGPVSTGERSSFEHLNHLLQVVHDVVGFKLYGTDE